jgi:hypothetical protein
VLARILKLVVVTAILAASVILAVRSPHVSMTRSQPTEQNPSTTELVGRAGDLATAH